MLRYSAHAALVALLACIPGCRSAREQTAPDWLKDPGPPQNPLPEVETRAYRACAADAECTVALNGCCNCANGGEDIAVNTGELARFRARFDCARTPCTEMGSMVPCASGKARCVEGLCRYEPPAPVH